VIVTASIRFEPAVQDQFGNFYETSVRLGSSRVSDILTRVTSGADSLWILNIAKNGYEKVPFNTSTQHTWAYFPLYPVLLRVTAKLTGNFEITGIVLSTTFLFLALVLLYQTAIAYDYDDAVADRAVFYVAAFPVSYFFCLTQTESLFLLLTVACFYAARRDRWWIAGVCGALASATRFAGVFLIIPLAILYWQRLRAGGKLRTDILSLLLVPIGLIVFMLYLRSITGNAMAFVDVQAAWGHDSGMFWRPMISYLRDPAQISWHWDFRLLNFAAAIMALTAGVVLLRRRQWAFAAYTLISILVPLSFQSSLQSIARYVMVIFPAFFVLADFGRNSRVDHVIRIVFVALLSLMSAMLATRVTLALS
jgi:hypothetical protein